MIYAFGLDSDPTFCYFLARAQWSGCKVHAVNLRELIADGGWHFVLPDEGSTTVTANGRTLALDPSASYYLRPIDLGPVQKDEAAALRWRGFILSLGSWFDLCSGRVVNRLSALSDNGTKPLHEHNLAMAGFKVPASITSADPVRLADFARRGPAIVKAVSGVRSNTKRVDADQLMRMDPRSGPLHVQRYVAGADIRAHVMHDAVFAELIRTTEVDYRDSRPDSIRFEPCELPSDLRRQLIEATRQFGLSFAGWDFKLDEKGDFWCLEANPMPGYHGYDTRAGGQITAALLCFLETGSTA